MPRLALALVLLLPAGARAAENCPARPSADRVGAVTPEGEFRLASGSVARLQDVRLPEGEHRGTALAWLAGHVGRAVALSAPGYPDRWGRLRATITPADAAPDLAEGLVAAGLALVDAGEADELCRPDLLRTEAEARRRRLGLWSTDRYKPVESTDLAALGAATGRFVLVEGRVRGVGERRSRTYLNFGPDWGTDLTITVPRRTWRIMQERGISAATLKARRVRARGVLEERRGPALEITVPDLLEVLDGAP